jgi:hypothetical protein
MLSFTEFLNESTIYSINLETVVTAKFLDTVLDDEYNTDFLKSQYIEEEIIDSDEIDEDDFKKWVKYELEYLAENFISDIKKLIRNGKLKIWRAMTVNKEWESNLSSQVKHLGIYWSWDSHSAEPHWGYDTKLPFTTLMEAEVEEIAINWIETVQMNINPGYTEEKEIRLVKGSKIKIVSIKIDNKEIDLTEISGEKFIA